MSDQAVPGELIGDAWSQAVPGGDPVLYGHVTLAPRGSFEVRSLQTFTLTYSVGRFGIDDTGSIKVVFRFSADGGSLQTEDPADYNYVTAHTSCGVPVRVSFDKEGHARPWFQALRVRAVEGYLREGDTVTIVFGDRARGSPGMRLQTFCESAFGFKVLADPCATGHFVPVAETPAIAIVPAAPIAWKVVLPTLVRPGDAFRLGLKVEDAWGNPSDQADATLLLRPSLPVAGLPERIDYRPGTLAVTLADLRVEREGILRVGIWSEAGERLTESNPMLIAPDPLGRYWGDLHGQSGESIGINTAREYFEFARDRSFLDACSHQANDFQINNAFWRHLNELTREFHEDHHFVTFPGYEWSGNTAVGGDRNVYFRNEGRQIHRSSHALLPDRSDIDTDATNANALFETLQSEDVVIYAHVGGRWADLRYAHEPKLETAVEIHSAWGTFEWLLHDALEQGYRCGVVCNSDGHKGRPGSSYPGASGFHAYGGLTCFIAPELTRDGIFESLRRRHHYGTTGNRLHLDVRARFDIEGRRFGRDPSVFDTTSEPVAELMMGDIAQTSDERITLSVHAISTTAIERIEIRNGKRNLDVYRPYQDAELGRRVRVIWSGAERRGRGAGTRWQGEARLSEASIEHFAKINAWNPERLLESRGPSRVVWDTTTSGNFGGFDAWLAGSREGGVEIETNHGSTTLALADIGRDPHRVGLGGLERAISVQRLPDASDHREIEHTLEVALESDRDNALWVCVTTEDGFQAWSSPIYVMRDS